MFIFRVSLPNRADGKARLCFCVQNPRNAYCLSLSPGRASLGRVQQGREHELASAPWGAGGKETTVEVQRKRSEIVVAADGTLLCRAEDKTFHGEGTAVEAVPKGVARLVRIQPLGPIHFTDDFMRTEDAGNWRPLSGYWEIRGVQWAERSVNPFSLFCRFEDTPRFTPLEEGRTRRYVGLGIRTEYRADHAVVLHVFDGTPAWQAGVRAGDVILAIDGQSALGTSRRDVVARLKGKEGQPVALRVARERDGQKHELDFRIDRTLVDLDTIERDVPIAPAQYAQQALITTGYDFWSDYTVEASVSGLGRGAMGLAAYVRDEGNGLRLEWSADKSEAEHGALSLVRLTNGRAGTLARKSGGYAPNQFYRLGLSVRGTEVRAAVDGQTVLSAEVPDLTWGRPGLYAAGSLGVTFDDVRVMSSKSPEPFLPASRTARYQPLFIKDEFMTEWAGAKNDWQVEPAHDGAVASWNRYRFPGDVAFEIQEDMAPEVTLIINADRAVATRGFRLHVNRTAKWFSLYRNRVCLAEKRPLSAAPTQIGLESDSDRVHVRMDGKHVKTFRTEALHGDLIGLVGIFKPSPAGLSISCANVLDYSFDRAPIDWWVGSGRWGIMNRWVCDPRWSWFGGRADAMGGTASLWHKRAFQGDVTLDVYAALAMPSYWKSPHERPGDLCVTICADDSLSPASGYSVIFAGDDNRWTRLYRGEQAVDETHSRLFLFPRRETSWDAAMRLHRRWHHLRLRKRGGHVTFHFDGRLALEYLDPEPLDRPGSGRVGIWTVNNTLLVSRARIAHEKPGLLPDGTTVNRRWAYANPDGVGFTNLVGSEISANVSPTGGGRDAHRVTNALAGGAFALGLLAKDIDVAKRRLLSLDFKADAETKVDLYFDLDDARHRIRLTGPEADDGRAIVLGAFPGVAGDGEWHATSFRLYDALKDLYPSKASFPIRNVMFANCSNEGYLLAGYGGNPPGARYWVRKVQFGNGAGADAQPPQVTRSIPPLAQAARPNGFVFCLSDESGIDESALRIDLNGKTLTAADPAVRFRRLDGELEIDLASAGLVLKDGEKVRISLSGLKDIAGNAAAKPCTVSWQYRSRDDKYPPTSIRINPGVEDTIRMDFEKGLGDCCPVGAGRRTMPGRMGGWLRRERCDDLLRAESGGEWYLRVQNLRMAHDFGVGFLTRPCDVARFPVLSLDYRIGRNVPVDLSLELDGERKVIRFSADAFRQELRRYASFETIGAAARVVPDGEWHHASVDLFGILRSHDATRIDYTAQRIHLGDDVTGYLGNYEGAAFDVDNIRIHPLLSRETLRPRWTAQDLSGIADHRIAVNADYGFVPTSKTLDVDVHDLKDGFAYIHLMLQDGAGNWSEPVHERIYLDVTPPEAVRFHAPEDAVGTVVIHFIENGGLDPKSIRLSVAGKEYAVNNKTMWYDQQRQTLTWRRTSGAEGLFGSRDAVEVTLLAAQDFAGNRLAGTKTWTWRRGASKAD